MFQTARIRLTAWYLFIIMMISIVFSTFIYTLLCTEFNRLADRQRARITRQMIVHPELPPVPADLDLVQESEQRLLLTLFIINCGIFVGAGGIGYLLAGRTLQPIQQMMREQQQFTADASHELRTPIAALKSSVEVYLRDPHLSLKEAKTVLQQNLDAANQLQHLTDYLIELARCEDDLLSIPLESVELSKMVKKTIAELTPLAAQKQLTIESDVSETTFQGNESLSRQLILAVIDNAIKYSPMKATLTIRASEQHDRIALTISDQGSGISEQDLPHIFDRFYRSDKSRSDSKRQGYGLGLAIAKKIAERTHATLRVAETSARGTTFEITFPVVA